MQNIFDFVCNLKQHKKIIRYLNIIFLIFVQQFQNPLFKIESNQIRN